MRTSGHGQPSTGTRLRFWSGCWRRSCCPVTKLSSQAAKKAHVQGLKRSGTREPRILRPQGAKHEVLARSLCPGTGTHIRSAATVGGNLALAVAARPLESDLVTVLVGARAQVQVSNADGSRRAPPLD